MKIISHRGNTDGPLPAKENTLRYILDALVSFDVEIDIRMPDNKLMLGHDESLHPIDLDFLLENRESLWVHCKDINSLEFLKNYEINCFAHSNDDFVLSSENYILVPPDGARSPNSIIMMPELSSKPFDGECLGVITDYAESYS
jgi:hypothetical protein